MLLWHEPDVVRLAWRGVAGDADDRCHPGDPRYSTQLHRGTHGLGAVASPKTPAFGLDGDRAGRRDCNVVDVPAVLLQHVMGDKPPPRRKTIEFPPNRFFCI